MRFNYVFKDGKEADLWLGSRKETRITTYVGGRSALRTSLITEIRRIPYITEDVFGVGDSLRPEELEQLYGNIRACFRKLKEINSDDLQGADAIGIKCILSEEAE